MSHLGQHFIIQRKWYHYRLPIPENCTHAYILLKTIILLHFIKTFAVFGLLEPYGVNRGYPVGGSKHLQIGWNFIFRLFMIFVRKKEIATKISKKAIFWNTLLPMFCNALRYPMSKKMPKNGISGKSGLQGQKWVNFRKMIFFLCSTYIFSRFEGGANISWPKNRNAPHPNIWDTVIIANCIFCPV